MTDKQLSPVETFQERVRDRLRGDIGTLLPDEMLDEMIRKSVEEMLGRHVSTGWHKSEIPWFQKMVEDWFTQAGQAYIANWLEKNQATLETKVMEVIVAQAPRMLAELLLASLRNTSYDLSSRLPEMMQRALQELPR